MQEINKNPVIKKAGETFFVLMINLIENAVIEKSKFAGGNMRHVIWGRCYFAVGCSFFYETQKLCKKCSSSRSAALWKSKKFRDRSMK